MNKKGKEQTMKEKNISVPKTHHHHHPHHHHRHHMDNDTDYSSVLDDIDFHHFQIEDGIDLHEQASDNDDVFAIKVAIPEASPTPSNGTKNKGEKDLQPKEKTIGGGNCATKSTAVVLGAAMVAGAIIGLMAFAHFVKYEDIHFMAASKKGVELTENIITREELALHDTADDCWVVYYGIVYDMTNYARRHPGGRGIITRLAGTDGTNEYERFHSESLLLSIQSEIVGTLSTDADENYIEEDHNIGNGNGGSGYGSSNGNHNSNNNNSEPSPGGTSSEEDCLLEGSNCITMTELQSHNSASDCWVALYGIVYDLTDYAQRHPAGSSLVTDLAGTDGTVAYERFHPESLLDSVQDDIVGTLFLSDLGGSENEGITNNNNNNIGSNDDDHDSAEDDDCPDCVTLAELHSHNTASDCWVALYGIVYDLTDYAQRHPAGSRLVTDLAGTDGTYEYARFHGESLLRSVQGDIVGTLLLSDDSENQDSPVSDNNNNGTNNDTSSSSTILPPFEDCPNCITMAELQRHNTASDCWVALYGNVYDLTNYAKRHPAGESFVTDLAGTDGTAEYALFHLESMLGYVQNDIVGTLFLSTGNDSTSPEDDINNDNDNNNGDNNDDGMSSPISNCSASGEEGSASGGNCVTIIELQLHNTISDCWVALYGNVYDLTNYARRHPAGSRLLTDLAGTDGTREYARFHRESLLESVRSYMIGPYEGGTEEIGNGSSSNPEHK